MGTSVPTPLIDIRPDHWQIVRGILRKHVPQYEVWAFGSRAKWTAKEYSDLDLAVITSQPLPLNVSAALADDFSESDLPWKVDVVDWATTSEAFRKIIERDRVVVQEKKVEGECFASMPENWCIRTIEAVCTRVTSGGTPSRSNPGFYVEGVWPWVKTQELQDRWIEDTEEHITVKAVDSSSAKVLPANTVLIAMYGATVGQLGLLKYPMTCNQASCALIVDPNEADYRFVFYQILHARDRLKNLAIGAAQQNLSGQLIKSLEFLYPPIEEQRAIAHILGTLDDKIELNRRMNETLEAMARALFKSWFVDFDGVAPEDMQQSELGLIPKGWRVGTLADFATLNLESWTKKTRPNEILYVDLSNIKWGRIENAIPYSSENAPSRAQRVLRFGDTVVGTVRPGNGSYAFINEDGLTGSTGFAVLRPKRSEYAAVIYLAATAPENIERLANLADGGAYPAVRPEIVAATCIPMADYETIFTFSQRILPIFERIGQNERESKTLAKLRDTLLPKLISGELRMKEAGRIIEEAT
ncbi:MAG: restriction endonuclease subunit S [Burkholderiaceae bacterium]|jgi:type I restriction enzyme S subunit|nr:restriction endonuclease subunit S [Burkholderiaceae bacterium]